MVACLAVRPSGGSDHARAGWTFAACLRDSFVAGPRRHRRAYIEVSEVYSPEKKKRKINVIDWLNSSEAGADRYLPKTLHSVNEPNQAPNQNAHCK